MGRDTIAGLIAGILQKYSAGKKEVSVWTVTNRNTLPIICLQDDNGERNVHSFVEIALADTAE